MSASLYLYFFACLPHCMSISLYICLFVCQSHNMSVSLYVCLQPASSYSSIYSYIHLFNYSRRLHGRRNKIIYRCWDKNSKRAATASQSHQPELDPQRALQSRVFASQASMIASIKCYKYLFICELRKIDGTL